MSSVCVTRHVTVVAPSQIEGKYMEASGAVAHDLVVAPSQIKGNYMKR